MLPPVDRSDALETESTLWNRLIRNPWLRSEPAGGDRRRRLGQNVYLGPQNVKIFCLKRTARTASRQICYKIATDLSLQEYENA
jgi:hypothetical protein